MLCSEGALKDGKERTKHSYYGESVLSFYLFSLYLYEKNSYVNEDIKLFCSNVAQFVRFNNNSGSDADLICY